MITCVVHDNQTWLLQMWYEVTLEILQEVVRVERLVVIATVWRLDIGHVWRWCRWRLLSGARARVVPGLSASSAETGSFGCWVAVVCWLSYLVPRLGHVSLLLLFSSCGIERPQRVRYDTGPVDGPMSCLFDARVWSLNGKHEAPSSSPADPGTTSVLLVFGVIQVFAIVAVMLVDITLIKVDLHAGGRG